MSELHTDEVITTEEQIIIDSLDKPKPFNILSMFGITSIINHFIEFLRERKIIKYDFIRFDSCQTARQII